MARLLAFDTATDRMSVALRVGDRLLAAHGPAGAQASAELLPTVRRLLDKAGVPLTALDAIAFGRGPGAFTGLRTACAVAQGLALGAGLPVLSLDTLLAVAECARDGAARCDVWVAMDARMGEVYAAHHIHADGSWRTVAEAMLVAPEALARQWAAAPPSLVAGSAIAAQGGRLGLDGRAADDTLPSASAPLLRPGAWPSPAALDALAADAWLRGAVLDPAAALPHYVRDQVALTVDEREAARAARAA